MTKSFSDYDTSDSISLAKIDGKAFTIVGVVDSAYTEQGKEPKPGVKITTKEQFKVDGKEWNVFHTTRETVVKALTDDTIRADLASGEEIGLVKCEKVEGKRYFVLKSA